MEKLSHAYIVSCASESAGLEKAYELAQTMLCSSGSERPCGVCRDCRKVKARIVRFALYGPSRRSISSDRPTR